MDTQSLYFRSIARCFLKHRGTPFFLSPRELDLIAEWKKKGIPLSVVLEGIERTFNEPRERRTRKRKNLSLLYCNKQVERAFHQHKERQIGGQTTLRKEEDKAERIQAEISEFLRDAPQQLKEIADLFRQAERLLSEKKTDDERLEQVESEIEDLLINSALEEEKDLIQKKVRKEYKLKDEREVERVARVRLIKYLRDKFQIPHISPYYY
jgi:hypothetical protein